MASDTPLSVSDADALRCKYSLPGFMAQHRTWYQWFFSYVLGRQLTLEEADSIRGRVNGFGPVQWEHTWEYFAEQAAAERKANPKVSSWRAAVE